MSFLRSTPKADLLRKAENRLDKVPLSLFWWPQNTACTFLALGFLEANRWFPWRLPQFGLANFMHRGRRKTKTVCRNKGKYLILQNWRLGIAETAEFQARSYPTGGYWISNELKTNAVLLFSLISFTLSSYMFFTRFLLIYLSETTWYLGRNVSSLLKGKAKVLTGLSC